MNPSHITQSLLDALAGAIGPDSARRLIALETEPDVEARLEELGDKANEGALTPEEHVEYSECVQLIDIIGILQSKARMSLRAAGQ